MPRERGTNNRGSATTSAQVPSPPTSHHSGIRRDIALVQSQFIGWLRQQYTSSSNADKYINSYTIVRPSVGTTTTNIHHERPLFESPKIHAGHGIIIIFINRACTPSVFIIRDIIVAV
eukprot:scaffold14247_cov207-Alexandrium_tamarense.AAC.3